MKKAVYTYDIYPLLRDALFPKFLPLDTSDNDDKELDSSWEAKVVMGVLFAVFAVVLIFGLASRRLLKIKRQRVDRIRLRDDFDEVEFQEDKVENLRV